MKLTLHMSNVDKLDKYNVDKKSLSELVKNIYILTWKYSVIFQNVHQQENGLNIFAQQSAQTLLQPRIFTQPLAQYHST